MSLWIVVTGSIFIAVLCIIVLLIAMIVISDQGGSVVAIDMSIYTAGDKLLLEQHLRWLLLFKALIISWPFICVLSITMLWVAYFKNFEALYYWWLLFPILVCIVIVVVASQFESRSEMAFRPSHQMIDRRYFKCEANRALEGGIYGKGPFKRLGPYYCRGWVEINEDDFNLLAKLWYEN